MNVAKALCSQAIESDGTRWRKQAVIQIMIQVEHRFGRYLDLLPNSAR